MAEAAKQSVDVSQLIDGDNKNKQKIVCEKCSSCILQAKHATYVNKETDLPLIRQKKSEIIQNRIETEKMRNYWVVNDMYTFENIGFTNAVDNVRYLICADCEIGPIGYQDMTNQKELFVAVDRVKHVD